MKVFVLFLLLLAGSLMEKSVLSKIDVDCQLVASAGKAIDTVIIKADYIKSEMLPRGDLAITYLEKNGKLKLRHHYYAIQINTVHCSGLWLTCGDSSKDSPDAPSDDEVPIKVTLTCLVFRDNKIPLSNNKPFVIVTKIRKG